MPFALRVLLIIALLVGVETAAAPAELPRALSTRADDVDAEAATPTVSPQRYRNGVEQRTRSSANDDRTTDRDSAAGDRASGNVGGAVADRARVDRHVAPTAFNAPADANAADRAGEPRSAAATHDHAKTLPLATKRPSAAAVPGKAEADSGWSTLLSVLGSLGIVLGLFLLVVWFLRRTNPQAGAVLPGEVFEVLGRAPLVGRQQAQLIRCGNKLVLLSVTPSGAEALAEITEPAEVERLAGLCQQARPNSATATFRGLFAQFGAEDSSAAPRLGTAKVQSLGNRSTPRTRTEVVDG